MPAAPRGPSCATASVALLCTQELGSFVQVWEKHSVFVLTMPVAYMYVCMYVWNKLSIIRHVHIYLGQLK